MTRSRERAEFDAKMSATAWAAEPRFSADAYDLVLLGIDVAREATRGDTVHGGDILGGALSSAVDLYGPAARSVLSRFGFVAARDIGEAIRVLLTIGALALEKDETVESVVASVPDIDIGQELDEMLDVRFSIDPPTMAAGRG